MDIGDKFKVIGHEMILYKGNHVEDSVVFLKGLEPKVIDGWYLQSPCGSWEVDFNYAKENFEVIKL